MTALDLAKLIQTRLAALEAEKPAALGSTNYLAWRDHWRKAEALAEELARDHGATYRPNASGACHFRFAGVGSSCTGGALALLTAWSAKVLRAGT